jgi:flagellar protein FlaG
MSSDALNTIRMPAYTPSPAGAAAKAREPVQAQTPAAPVPQDAPPPQLRASAAAVKAAAQQIESYLKSNGRELDFQVDRDSGQVIVSVRDSETGELIRQIPGEDVLRMARALKQSAPSLVHETV